MLGEGIIKGMAETARNFLGSYVSEDRLTTVQYPEERLPQKEAARNFPFLLFDGKDPHIGLRCVAFQICVEVCPFDAIKMDTEYELSTSDRFGELLLNKDKLAKSNEYYEKIHPTEAAEVDERLAAEKAKAGAKAKGEAEAKAAALPKPTVPKPAAVPAGAR